MEPTPVECPICLSPIICGGLSLGCCVYSFHVPCLLPAFQDDVLQQWRCPCCRTAVDPAAASCQPALAAASSASAAGCDRRRDIEACGASSLPGSAAAALPAKQYFKLAAVNHFICTASRALVQEAAHKTGVQVSCVPAALPSSSCCCFLSAAEHLLPEAAADAAAAALANLGLQSLLHPKECGVTRQCIRWAGAALLLSLGCTALALLLAQYMLRGMIVLARVNLATGRLFGLYGSIVPAAGGAPEPWCIVGLLCIATLSATAQILLRRHKSLSSVLLRLDRHAPALLLLLAGISLSLATAILAATWLFSLCAIVGGAYLQPSGAHHLDVAAATTYEHITAALP